jgi:hypothetical protein
MRMNYMAENPIFGLCTAAQNESIPSGLTKEARMKDDLDAVARYRERATELRVVAGNISDKDSRKTMLEIAQDYERLARLVEFLDRRDRDPSGDRIAHAGDGPHSPRRSRPAPDYNGPIYWQKFTP